MGGEVRYCTTEDGVRIAYKVEGEGPPLLALPPLLESFAVFDLLREAREALQRIGRGRRLIRFDARGTGLSDRDVTDMSRTALRRDLEAVIQALGLRRISLWGTIVGGTRLGLRPATSPRCGAPGPTLDVRQGE